MDEIQSEKLSFDIVIGNECNYHCKYCYEELSNTNKILEPITISKDILSRYIEYLNYQRSRHSNKRVIVNIYGGEPMLYFDKLARLVAKSVNGSVYNLITNGSLILENKNNLINLIGATKLTYSRLVACVSYDFSIQNEMREEGSYESVRDAIRWLYKEDVLDRVITVFTKVYDVFQDFISLREELPGIRATYNLDLGGDLSGFDREATEESLKKMAQYLDEHPEHWRSFYHNVRTPFREVKGGLFGNICSCVDPNGDVYSGYYALFKNEEAKNALKYGNIFDNFEDLDKKKDEIISTFKLSRPDMCKNCNCTCKAHLYSNYIKDGDK